VRADGITGIKGRIVADARAFDREILGAGWGLRPSEFVSASALSALVGAALGLGALLLGAGVLLFVSAHWDQLSSSGRAEHIHCKNTFLAEPALQLAGQPIVFIIYIFHDFDLFNAHQKSTNGCK